MKMEACFSETLIELEQNKQHYVPEASKLHYMIILT
jgi:hypothetical protein